MHAEMLRVCGTGEFFGVFEQMVDNGHIAQDILKFDTHFSRFTPRAEEEAEQERVTGLPNKNGQRWPGEEPGRSSAVQLQSQSLHEFQLRLNFLLSRRLTAELHEALNILPTSNVNIYHIILYITIFN